MRERERGRKGVRTKCDKIDTILCWSGPGVGEVKGQTFILFSATHGMLRMESKRNLA